MQFRVREIGNWPPGCVRADWAVSSRTIVDRVERMIDAAWHEAARRPGVLLFDGPLCRLETVRADAAEMRLTLSRTSYRTFLGTNLAHPQLADEHGPGIMANPVGLSAAVVTTDHYMLLGRRGANVAYHPGRVHPFAGALEPSEPLDVFAELRRELREELSPAAGHISAARCVGLIEDVTLRQPELVFVVHVAQPARTLAAAVDATEHEEAVVLPLTDRALRDAMDDPSYTPVAAGTIALLGRALFGAAWFASVYPRADSP